MLGTPSMRGLGASSEYVYPWREEADSTYALQRNINFLVRETHLPEIAADGILGAQTCGAMAYLESALDNGNALDMSASLSVADCREFAVYPPPPTAPPPAPSSPAELPPPPTATRRSRASFGTVGWLAVAGTVAAVGLYLANRRK